MLGTAVVKELRLQVNDQRPDRRVIAYEYIEYHWQATSGCKLLCTARLFWPAGGGKAANIGVSHTARWRATGTGWQLYSADPPLDDRRGHWPPIPREFEQLLQDQLNAKR